jgi:predicted negative regulator of RcsB-dependent stress response
LPKKAVLLHSALGDPTYSEQAHFYLAKAYLKKQDVAGAQRELQAAASFHGAKETRSR